MNVPIEQPVAEIGIDPEVALLDRMPCAAGRPRIVEDLPRG